MQTIIIVINKIKLMFIIYCILIPLIMILNDTLPKMNPRNDSNKSYVPKQKRGNMYRFKQWMICRVNKWYTWIIHKSELIKIDRKVRQRIVIARTIGQTKNKYSRRRKLTHNIMALSVVAMVAGQHDKVRSRRQRSIHFDTDSEHVGIDNRCSACISHKIEDFIGSPNQTKRTIKGFGGARINNIMKGTIKWKWSDDQGKIHEFKIPNSYYVPEGGVRLLSPQHWAQEQRKVNKRKDIVYGCNTMHHSSTLYWNDGDKLTVPIDPSNNVATFTLAPGFGNFKLFCEKAEIEYEKECLEPIICNPAEMEDDEEVSPRYEKSTNDLQWPNDHSPDNTEFNINEKTKNESLDTNGMNHECSIENGNLSAELLELHQRYGHISFKRLVEMSRQGVIHKKYSKCQIPTCSACLFAKATKRKWRDKGRNDFMKIEAKQPGDCVSVDQLVSPTPGLVAQMTGKLTTKRYKYATVFVDQATRLGYIYLQTTADADETIKAKRSFEEYASQRGVQIKAYHADNGIFRANKWVNACRESKQPLTFAGVNAHHQNGIAERRIRSLQEMTRAMLIHANKRWPEAITPNLWPYAMRMANDSLNDTPNMQDSDRRTAAQMFSSTIVQHNTKHQKTFGCPTYVLDSKLQSGNIFHKWNSRSKVGIYLGKSPQHSRNVALILDRFTGLVSPQFHIVHDNKFETLKQEKYESRWQVKAGFVSVAVSKKDTLNAHESNDSTASKKRQTPIDDERVESDRRKAQKTERAERVIRRNRFKDSNQNLNKMNVTGDKVSNSEGVKSLDPEGADKSNAAHEKLDAATIPQIEVSAVPISDDIGEIFCMETLYPDMMPNVQTDAVAFKAVADPDVMYMHQAMRQHDKSEFIKAMSKEVKDQTENGNFSIVDRKSVPKDKTILKAVWQMRRKRDIKTQEIKKYKARLNIDGSKMAKGIDYDDTYAPVATWRTIRLILSLASVHNWHTRQLDYVLAFPQAPVERELYMEVPKGFVVNEGDPRDYLLKIHRNIYGQKQAGRVWNQYLVQKLTKEIGFKQSKIDECLFYKGNVLYALYTDDSILAGPDKKEVDEIIDQMRKAKLDITDEGNVEDFLGVNIERRTDGTVKLSQPHLINQILKDLKMDKQPIRSKETPAASSKILSKFPESQAFDNSFHYRSVIGKLNYLEKCTRPDIAYATHQCARFTENPKIEHGKAVRWLARYLKGTIDKGIIMSPNDSVDLQLFVDADFSGNWTQLESNDRDSARSRHGYIITYNGCPLLWKSQMQTEIALSSTESEYIGISSGLRDVIPIMRTLQEMKEEGFPIGRIDSDVYCRVFEDNSGALEMAKVHKYRPRTKHMNVKYHHFREYVTRGDVTLHAIRTDDQPADMLTKPLNYSILTRHRKTVMGW